MTHPDATYLMHTAEAEYNGDIFATCVALQDNGNLTGPDQSVAAQVVLFFRDVTQSVDPPSGFEQEELKRYMVEFYMTKIVGDSLAEDKARFEEFLKSDKKVMEFEASFQSFVAATQVPLAMMEKISSTADSDHVAKFVHAYGKVLKSFMANA